MKTKSKRNPSKELASARISHQANNRAIFDVLRQKVTDLVKKDPKKAARVIALWLHESKRSKTAEVEPVKKKKAG